MKQREVGEHKKETIYIVSGISLVDRLVREASLYRDYVVI